MLDCSLSALNLKYDSFPNDKIAYSAENDMPELVAANWEHTTFAGNDLNSRISSASYLSLKIMHDAYFSIKVNTIVSFSDLKGFGTQFNVGYASDVAMKPNAYHDYVIRNRVLWLRHPRGD